MLCIAPLYTRAHTTTVSDTVKFSSFPKTYKLSIQRSLPLTGTRNYQPIAYTSSIVFFRNIQPETYHFIAYDIQLNKQLAQVLPFGSGKNQASSFLSRGILAGRLWVQDLGKGKLLSLSLADFPALPDTLSAVPLPIESSFITPVSNDVCLVTGNYNSPYMAEVFNTRLQKVTGGYIPYPHNTNSFYKSANESFIILRPDGSKFALAGRKTDVLHITDVANGADKTFIGPQGFAPDMDRMKRFDNVEIAITNNKTRHGYVGLAATQNYIYALYSGNNVNGTHTFLGNKVYVYSWSGRPVAQLSLPAYTHSATVTPDDKTLLFNNSDTHTIDVCMMPALQ